MRKRGRGREGGEGSINGEEKVGDYVTWIARRARPNRMVKGFENVDMAIPLTRPVTCLSIFLFFSF